MAGNANSGSWTKKPFRDALKLELKIRDAGEDMKTLRRIAGGVIDDALGDEPFKRRDAINMIADRIDGKPAQAIVGGDDDDNPIHVVNEIRRTIVDPKPNPDNTDSASISTAPSTRQA